MHQTTVTHTNLDEYGFFEYIRKTLLQIYHFRYFIFLLFRRILKNRYKDSFLGVLWSLITPMITMSAMAVIFPLLMKFRVENYVIYLFSGFIGWHFISSSLVNGGSSISSRAGLIKKYSIPKILFPLTLSLVEIFNFCVTLLALVLVLLMMGFEIQIDIVYLLLAFAVTYVFALSLGIITSVLFVYFRDLQHLVGVVMQALFYLTPIIYTVHIIPEKYMYLMQMNIFYHYINLFHGAIYDNSLITLSSFIIPACISIVTLLIALFIFKKLEKNLIYRL